MISNEDYKKALRIVEQYEGEMNTSIVEDKTCCVCKKNTITKLEGRFIHPTKQERGMWKDGVVEKIIFGFGSKFDTNGYYIAICDDCIYQLESEGIVENLKNIRDKYKYYGV